MVDISIAIFIQKQNLFTNLTEWCSLKYIKCLSFLVVKNAPALTNSQKSIQQFAIFEKKPKTKPMNTDLLNVATKPFFLCIWNLKICFDTISGVLWKTGSRAR